MFNEAGKSEEENTTFPNFEKVWQKVENKLDKKQEKKKLIPIWLPYGIAAGLALTFGVLYFMNDDNAKIEPQIVDRIEGKPARNQQNDSLKIQNLDRKIQENIAANPIENSGEIIAYEAPIPPKVEVYAVPPSIASPVADAIALKTEANYYMRDGNYTTDEYYINKTEKIGSVSKVSAAELQRAPNSNVVNALSGKVAGVKISKKIEDLVAYNDSRVTEIEEVKLVGESRKMKSSMNASYSVVSSQSISKMLIENSKNSNQFRFRSTRKMLAGKVDGALIPQEHSFLIPNRKLLKKGLDLSKLNEPIVVIDGEVYKMNVSALVNPEIIENIEEISDNSLVNKYGKKAENGVIKIETKNLSDSQKRKLKRTLKHWTKEGIGMFSDSEFYEKAKIVNTDEEYNSIVENPFENIQNQPLSTFSIDVDKAAYSNIRRMINNGQKVDKNAVRIEEIINYFNYQYPQPKANRPFSINTEYNDAPWNPNHKLLKIGLQGMNALENNLPASNLVFLIDVSGSMDEENKLPLLKESFKVLLEKLRPQDKVALVVYAGSAGTVLEPTSATEKDKIIEALDDLNAGGSTAGGEGIELAYKLAQENFIKNGNNRVILATDGDFNVGSSSQADLQTLIEEKRQTGIFLTCLGFGMGNYKDNTLETLADKGNGNYAYIDNLQEANKFLGKEFAGSMYAIAKDVKIQIEFNPKFVKSYRLIGYENRKLRNEDFKNDKIDAGELGIGHTVTALYEVIPQDVESDFAPENSDLKYSQITEFGVVKNELATIKFRYKNPDSDKSLEMIQTITESDSKIEKASPDFKFATSVAWFGLVLRNSQLIKDKDLTKIVNLAKQGKSNDEEGYRSEIVRLIETYRGISK